jgi:hypothetical protein
MFVHRKLCYKCTSVVNKCCSYVMFSFYASVFNRRQIKSISAVDSSDVFLLQNALWLALNRHVKLDACGPQSGKRFAVRPQNSNETGNVRITRDPSNRAAADIRFRP